MARSRTVSAFAFPAEVARFLEVDGEDVRRMIELDGLPATKLPKAKRVVHRIYLPDLHDWLVRRSDGSPRLANYQEFVEKFRSAVDNETERGTDAA